MLNESGFSRIVETVYEAVVDPHQWPLFLELASAGFEADVATFACYDTRNGEHTVNACLGLDAGEIRQYEEHFSTRNTWVERGGEKCLSGVVVGEQLCPVDELRHGEYYNDFLKKRDVGCLLATSLRGSFDRFSAVSFLRSERRGSFDRRAVALLERMRPHLKQAAEIHDRMRGAHAVRQLGGWLADDLAEGLILLDDQDRPLLVNRAARDILRDCPSVTLTSRGLAVRWPALAARLRYLLHSVRRPLGAGTGESGGALAVHRAHPLRPLLLLVTRAAHSATTPSRRRPSALVWLRDPHRAGRARGDWLRTAYALTGAESRLLQVLGSGVTLSGAADQVGISRHTARSQVASLLAKTGTHRQADLLRLARSGDAVGALAARA
jgi:DNA-binding CsgD family transcriptional regulator